MNKNVKTTKEVFGIFDEFENKLRMGFVSHDAKQLVLDTASQIVEVSLAGGEETYKFYENKTLRFKEALKLMALFWLLFLIIWNYF